MPGISGVHGTVTPGGRHVVTMVLCRVGCAGRGGPVWAGQARCADAVRGCPCGPAARSPRARTYGGQRRRSEHRLVAFTQVRWYMEVQAGAFCKTVGSAYVGSNPTPATSFRRSRPVTRDCVTGFSRERERLRRPLALGVGHAWARFRHLQLPDNADSDGF